MGAIHIGPPPWVTDPDERLKWNVYEAVEHGLLPLPPPDLEGEALRTWATTRLKAKSRSYLWMVVAIVLVLAPILVAVYLDLKG